MRTASLWIVRVALAVQFLGVLAVPPIVAAAESPRGIWIAEWLNPTNEPALSESRTSLGKGRLEMIKTPKPRDPKTPRPEELL